MINTFLSMNSLKTRVLSFLPVPVSLHFYHYHFFSLKSNHHEYGASAGLWLRPVLPHENQFLGVKISFAWNVGYFLG